MYRLWQLLNSKQDDEGSPLKVPKLGDGTAQSANGTATLPSESHTSTADFGLDSRTSNDDISNIELRFTQDESRKTRFGATEVTLQVFVGANSQEIVVPCVLITFFVIYAGAVRLMLTPFPRCC